MKHLVLILCLLTLAACGNDSPTDPGGGGGAAFEDTPAIPRPTSPGGSVPAVSDVLTLVTRGTLDDFAPRVLDIALTTGNVYARARTSCAWELVEIRTNFQLANWNGQLSYSSADCGNTTLLLVALKEELRPQGNMRLVSGGSPHPDISRDLRGGTVFEPLKPTALGFVRTVVTPARPLEHTPHLRRDRFWRLRPIDGGVGDFLLLTGPTSGEISTSYTVGVERTETESFGRSVTGEVSANLGVLSASVSATLSENFESSVSITEATTTTFTKSVRGEEGKTVQFMVWELVEVYSFSDPAGDLFEAEGWTFAADTLTRAGAAMALDATSFPAK